MPIQTLSLLVLRYNTVQRRAHISANIGVVVLVQRERAGRVLDEEVQEAGLVAFDFGDLLEDVVGD
jgi:hypothetical protein